MITKYLTTVLIVLVFCSFAHGGTCPTKQYKNRLAKLDLEQVSSVELAANELIKLSQSKNDKCKDELMHYFKKFYYKAMDTFDTKSNVSSWRNPISVSKEAKFNASISGVGWKLRESEGTYYIGESGGWFEKKFKSILSKPYRKYLSLKTKELKEGHSEDQVLLISWEQLRKRITTWEQFLKNHPDFVENSEIRDLLNRYVVVFLLGMDNSQIYESDRRLSFEVKTAYEKFIRENKTSLYYPLVKDYYEMLRNNSFIVPENSHDYLRKKGGNILFGKQPVSG